MYNEARRQCSLLQIRDELKKRGVTESTLECSTHEVTRVVSKALYSPIKTAIASGLRVMCVVLRGFGGLLNWSTQEDTSFATEFSDRIRVIACLNRLPNMVHSDTAAECLSARDWKAVAKRTGAGHNDVMILVWGDAADTKTACDEIVIRAREATVGVPSDTRQGHADGTNGFERVLPGADRMYPDTDLPPIAVTEDRVERIRAGLPEFVWDRRARYVANGLPDPIAVDLCLNPRVELYDRIVSELDVQPMLVAVLLCQWLKSMRRLGLKPDRLSDDAIYSVFSAYASGNLTREGIRSAIRRVLIETADQPLPPDAQDDTPAVDAASIQHAVAALDPAQVSDDDLKTGVADTWKEAEEQTFANSEQKRRFVLGALMRRFERKVDGQKLVELVSAKVGK